MNIRRIGTVAAPALAGALVVATAVVHVGWWQDRYVAPFDAAVIEARSASAETADAFAALGEARVAAGPVADKATAFADAAAGYLGATELDALRASIALLGEALGDQIPVAPTVPPFTRPLLTQLDSATDAIVSWTRAERDEAAVVDSMLVSINVAVDGVNSSAGALTDSVVASASAELAAATLATAEARAAVEQARDALVAAEGELDLAALTEVYAVAVAGVRSSQAAGAAAQESTGDGESYGLSPEELEAFKKWFHDDFCAGLGFGTGNCP